MRKKEAYSALNLDPSATEEEAKKKFKELSKKYHPDICKDSDATEKFKKINEAYDAIKNNNFDDNRQVFSSGSSGSPFSGINIEDLNDLLFFNNMGGKKVRRNFPPIEISTHLSFKEAVFGAKKEVSFNRRVKCQKCSGEGRILKNNGCKTCNGIGRVTKAQGNVIMTQTCGSCHGRVSADPCQQCSSSGSIPSDVTVSINIPPGVFGNTLRLSGVGHYLGSGGLGDQNADVYVHVSADEDSYFKVEDENLISNIDIKLSDALEGKEVSVRTLDGDQMVIIPQLSKNKDEIIIPNLGIGRVGCQKVVLNITYPENILSILPQIKELN